MEKIEIKQIPITQIKPYWKNPRKDHDIEGIKKSIQKFGLNSPIVIDKNYVIIIGHGRHKALIQLEYKKVPCIIKNLDQKTAKEYRIVDNKLSENSKWEDEFLRQELMDIDDPIGFDFKELEHFRNLDYNPKNFDEGKKIDIERWIEPKHKKISLICPYCLNEYEINEDDIFK